MQRIALLIGLSGCLLMATACGGQGPAQQTAESSHPAVAEVQQGTQGLDGSEGMAAGEQATDQTAHAVAGTADEAGTAAPAPEAQQPIGG